MLFFFFQAEDGIRDLVRSRGLGDVYKRQEVPRITKVTLNMGVGEAVGDKKVLEHAVADMTKICLLYTSDAADRAI